MSRESEQRDYDVVAAVFSDLSRLHGLVTRMNFWCCGGCSAGAIDRLKTKEGQGAVWFHTQFSAMAFKGKRLVEPLKLMWDGDPAVVPNLVIEAFEKEGMVAKWDGNPYQCIRVFTSDFDWKSTLGVIEEVAHEATA